MTWAAIVGTPVGHSRSLVLHRAAWDSLGLDGWEYRRLDTDVDALPALIASLDSQCAGLSVTMPLKQAVIPLLDAIDPMAQAVGTVNTVVPAGGVLTGFNTDVHGIFAAISQAREGADLPPARSAVILGSRATASSALAALGQLHVGTMTVVARRIGGPGSTVLAATRMGLTVEHIAWSHASEVLAAIEAADILISTVPAGASDDLAGALTARPNQTLLDVVYSPLHTPLVRRWLEGGGVWAPGYDMLLHQAVQQVRLMTGRDPDVEVMREALLAAL